MCQGYTLFWFPTHIWLHIDPIAEASLNVDIHKALLDPPDKLASSTCGGNTAVPILSQKPPLSTGPTAEGLDGNGPGSSGLPAKKKRQLWTKEGDVELIAAVQKCGEGNWVNILKGDFKHNRFASQISQRWVLIRKCLRNSDMGNGNKTSISTRSEERLAAQKAFSLAVDMPMTGSLSAIISGATQMTSSSTSSAAISQASRACAAQSLNQSQDKGISSLFIKARSTLKKPTMPGKPLGGPNPLIQAAAFAARGRIANPSTAASLFKAAQSKNAVHIRPGESSLPISSTMTNKSSATIEFFRSAVYPTAPFSPTFIDSATACEFWHRLLVHRGPLSLQEHLSCQVSRHHQQPSLKQFRAPIYRKVLGERAILIATPLTLM